MTPTTRNSGFPPGLALLIGGAAGFTAGMLIAGKSGARLRAEIGEAVDDTLQCATGKIRGLKDQGSELAQKGLAQVRRAQAEAGEKVKQTVNRAVDEGESEAHNAINSTVAAVHSAADKSHQAVSGAADAIRTGTNG
jgi:gas vesicle protein